MGFPQSFDTRPVLLINDVGLLFRSSYAKTCYSKEAKLCGLCCDTLTTYTGHIQILFVIDNKIGFVFVHKLTLKNLSCRHNSSVKMER